MVDAKHDVPDPDEALSAWPSHWPGRHVINLDNVGDPGWWLGAQWAALGQEAMLAEENEEENAAFLAADYLVEIREQGYPLPSDFGDESGPKDGWTESDEALVISEFRTFLACWRERVEARVNAAKKMTKGVGGEDHKEALEC
jgi:hypothetical protein